MFKFCCPLFIIIIISIILSLGYLIVSGSDSDSWLVHEYVRQGDRQFEQKTNRFWEFEEQSESWVEVELPYDLVSCVNNQCTKVNRIEGERKKKTEQHVEKQSEQRVDQDGSEEIPEPFLPLRKRVSLRRMSESSIWVTGESGSIYERFWNGLQWVIAPHELPVSAGYAVSVFIVNQTILALSEGGVLYQVCVSVSPYYPHIT